MFLAVMHYNDRKSFGSIIPIYMDVVNKMISLKSRRRNVPSPTVCDGRKEKGATRQSEERRVKGCCGLLDPEYIYRNEPQSQSEKDKAPEWLDEDFLQLCMQSGENDPTIRVLKHSVSVANVACDPFSSSMYRVSVEFKRRPRSRNILDFKPQEIRSLVIKLMTQNNGQGTLAIESARGFEREITMLSKTIPSIHKVLGNQHLAAHCLYWETQPRALIVLEDLKSLGFEMAHPTRHRGLDLDHSSLVMRSLATFHAGSIAVYEKDPTMMQNYQSNMWCKQSKLLTKDFVERIVVDVADEVSTWPGYDDKYAHKLRRLRDTLLPRVNAAVAQDPDAFNVLLHGDCWYNNLMFRYSSTGSGADNLMFVDFQNSIFSSPVIDLQHFLYSTPMDEVRSQNFTRLLQLYHTTLVSTIEKLGTTTKVPSFDELKRELERREIYGVLVAFTFLPIVVSDNIASREILRDPNADKLRKKMYSAENFKIALKRLLPVFDHKGLLD